MLIIKTFVNENEIEEIMIQNEGDVGGGFYQYAIVKPEGYDKFVMFHMRELGWRSLFSQALNIILRTDPIFEEEDSEDICED